MPHYSPRMSSSTRRAVSPSPTVVSSSLHRRVAGAGNSVRHPKVGCAKETKKKRKLAMEPSVEKEEASEKEQEEEDPEEDPEEEEEEEEEDPDEEVPASTSLSMDIDAVSHNAQHSRGG
ncbi:hypothetical protein PIB30_058157 [Stylosanthes scabra]|uniref:Uncharacterized protein n=1 Tax=Stylosanthes scabra TaxID=79078 RepID=A0ABU6QKB8_9FABA|nr:hypothetical protein [Stylosanthes scabra]